MSSKYLAPQPDLTSESEEGEQISRLDPRAAFLSRNLERLGGALCFRGSRVPVESLFQHLAAGDTLDAFLEDFPGVSREAALFALQFAADRLIEPEKAA